VSQTPNPAGGASGAEPQPTPTATPAAPANDLPPAVLLQILATEHWSLLASRNLAWNESFTRTGMFLSTLSFAVVALALVGQATGFGEDFRLFALVVLPVVLFVGVATSLRLDNANYHDIICVAGMNRIRANYVEMAPHLERVFVMGVTDDVRGIELTTGNAPSHGWLADVIAATPSLLAVLNSMLVGAILALLLLQLGVDTVPAIGAGIGAFVVAFVLQALQWRRQFNELVSSYTPVYPDR
jgi:hypothetical protein